MVGKTSPESTPQRGTVVSQWWNKAVAEAQASHEQLFGKQQQHKSDVKGAGPKSEASKRMEEEMSMLTQIVDGSLTSPAHRMFLGLRTSLLTLPVFSVYSIIEASTLCVIVFQCLQACFENC